MPVSPTATIGESVVVYAENAMTRPFKGKYANQWYSIGPGETKLVPYHAMVLWAGDPRSVDKAQMHEKYRTHEYNRLRKKYGIYENSDRVGELPQIVYTDVESGERLITVIDNPEQPASGLSTGNVTADLQSQVSNLEAQLRALIRQKDVDEAADESEAALAPAEADTPEVPAARQRKGAGSGRPTPDGPPE
ncbi:MAG: hypothetical protein ACR2NL_05085 [Acidimicrobiia bacterium]